MATLTRHGSPGRDPAGSMYGGDAAAKPASLTKRLNGSLISKWSAKKRGKKNKNRGR